ncbi:hypothetical protein VTH82DRAFT_8438 [Thermothelomyces myriococcoides]
MLPNRILAQIAIKGMTTVQHVYLLGMRHRKNCEKRHYYYIMYGRGILQVPFVADRICGEDMASKLCSHCRRLKEENTAEYLDNQYGLLPAFAKMDGRCDNIEGRPTAPPIFMPDPLHTPRQTQRSKGFPGPYILKVQRAYPRASRIIHQVKVP